jgi:hypothetical protein
MRKMLAAMAGGMLAFTQWHCRPMPDILDRQGRPEQPSADS